MSNGDHPPGVTIVPLTADTAATSAALTDALKAKAKFLQDSLASSTYTVGGQTFAVLVTNYPG